MDRVQELAEQVRYHSDLYYNQGTPEITDAEFDALVDELRRLDPQNPALLEVGAKATYGQKVTHTSTMGSLNKVTSMAELRAWYEANRGKTTRLLVTPKIDGLAVRLVYEDGKLVLAATRGDGAVGQDVTANVREMKSVPKVSAKFSGELRGEVYMRKSVWEKMGDAANPRNAAAGSLMQKDAKVTGERDLSFFCYDAIFTGPNLPTLATEDAKLNFIAGLMGVQVVPHQVFDSADANLEAKLVEWENSTRARLDYEIDGMVISLMDIEQQNELGWNGKCPRGKVAYKFKPDQKVAEVVRIEWFVGRTGRVTPVAVITPTRLAGTTVTNVTLHNLGRVNQLDVRIGDKVLVEKAGDIIPQVVRVTERVASQNVTTVLPARQPTTCPTCGSDLQADDKNLWCQNAACPAKLERAVLHYLDSLGILGIGTGIVEKLCRAGMVKELGDLYYLDQRELVGLLGGERMAEKVYLAIMEKTDIELANFLDALGIDGLGTSTSKAVAKKLHTLAAVRQADVATLLEIEGIGAVTADAIVTGLKAMETTIDRLAGAVDVKEVATGGKLAGLSFCITGALIKQRALVEKDIEKAGGDVKSSVGRGLTYLVMADPNSTSSKAEKARKLGTKCISEAELYAMMN